MLATGKTLVEVYQKLEITESTCIRPNVDASELQLNLYLTIAWSLLAVPSAPSALSVLFVSPLVSIVLSWSQLSAPQYTGR